MTEEPAASGAGSPGGEVYDWFRRGEQLLSQGSPAAAAQLLRRVLETNPGSRSAREALARALFDARRYEEARAHFAEIVAADPADDYALFGLGLAALRAGDARAAIEHLSLAAAMKPHDRHYATALRTARARAGHTTPPRPEDSPDLTAPDESPRPEGLTGSVDSTGPDDPAGPDDGGGSGPTTGSGPR